MASALTALANASCTFTVVKTGVVTDPTTGNVAPATETVTVSLFLKSDKISGTTFPGVEVLETVFDGYCLSTLDTRVQVGTEGVVTFAGEGSMNCEVTGLRLPYGKTGLLAATLNAALGERIQLTSKEQNA
jgi:hypothetical protein